MYKNYGEEIMMPLLKIRYNEEFSRKRNLIDILNRTNYVAISRLRKIINAPR